MVHLPDEKGRGQFSPSFPAMPFAQKHFTQEKPLPDIKHAMSCKLSELCYASRHIQLERNPLQQPYRINSLRGKNSRMKWTCLIEWGAMLDSSFNWKILLLQSIITLVFNIKFLAFDLVLPFITVIPLWAFLDCGGCDVWDIFIFKIRLL